MTDNVAEWHDRATKTTDYYDMLKLVDEIAGNRDAPDYLRAAARRSVRSLTRYIESRLAPDLKGEADHHFYSFRQSFP